MSEMWAIILLAFVAWCVVGVTYLRDVWREAARVIEESKREAGK